MSDYVNERAKERSPTGSRAPRAAATPLRAGRRPGTSTCVVSSIVACLFLAAAVAATPALARNDVIQVTLVYVEETADDSNVLDAVEWHFLGTDHPAVTKQLDPVTAKASTSAAFKRDEDACARAFLSALIDLQTAAVARGANGVIDIRSIAGGQVCEEADRFLCRVGDVIAHVSLTGVPVMLETQEEEEEAREEGDGPQPDGQREARLNAPASHESRAE